MMHSVCARSGSTLIPRDPSIAVAMCALGVAVAALADGGAVRKPVLLYLLADPASKQTQILARCDQLTIARYESEGVSVLQRTHKDLETWLAGEGERFAKAHDGFKHVAYAKMHKADAIGGLAKWEDSEENAKKWSAVDGISIYTWGISLAGLSHNSVINSWRTNEPRAQALSVRGLVGDPWAIPLSVTPRACATGSRSFAYSMRGQPLLGVFTDGSKVSRITNMSPAEEAGLKIGDEIVSLSGKPIADFSDIVAALKDRKPDEEIDLEFRHDGELTKKRVTLADWFELLEIKLTPVGKPLPDLVAKDISGREIRLRDLRGKVVLVDYWATWCGPCLDELPVQQLLWELAKDRDFVWLGVSVDEDERVWRNFVRDNHLGGIQLRSPQWGDVMNIRSYPTILLVDRSGIVQCELGGESTAQAVLALLGKEGNSGP